MASVIRSAAGLQQGQLRTRGSCDRLLSPTPLGVASPPTTATADRQPRRPPSPPHPPALAPGLPFRVHCRLPHWIGTPWEHRGAVSFALPSAKCLTHGGCSGNVEGWTQGPGPEAHRARAGASPAHPHTPPALLIRGSSHLCSPHFFTPPLRGPHPSGLCCPC